MIIAGRLFDKEGAGSLMVMRGRPDLYLFRNKLCPGIELPIRIVLFCSFNRTPVAAACV